MASAIDITKPTTGNAYTADVRQNFATASSEISALQAAVAAGVPSGITNSTGTVVPGATTPGFNQPGSQYTNTAGTAGSFLYISNGDGTWAAIA
jgi:hypothetical protein